MKKETILILASIPIISWSNMFRIKEEKSSLATREIGFYVSDSITVYRDLYEFDKERSAVFLLHRGGSNAKEEYAPVIPGIIEAGFAVLPLTEEGEIEFRATATEHVPIYHQTAMVMANVL